MREEVPDNCRRISQNFSPAGVTSPFVARAMPTRSSDKRLRKYANLSSQRSSRRLIRNGAFQGCGSPVRLGLTLRRGTDNNLAHVNIGGLLDREHDGAGDRVGRDPHFVHAIADLALYFRTGHGFREVRVHEAR